jgi:hypothetical protein
MEMGHLSGCVQEIGRPVTLSVPPLPPTPEKLAHCMRLVAHYHHRLGSPDNQHVRLRVEDPLPRR